MKNFLDFFSFADPNVMWVLVGVMVMCMSSAVVGVFTYLRKRALVGDAISHAILPGICVSYLVFEMKSAWVLLPGACITGWLSLWMIDWITQNSRIKTDTAIALVMSVFYGVGILLMTFIQNSGSGSQSGLDKFLFGKAAALVVEDVVVFVLFAVFVLWMVIFFYTSFRVLIFDKNFAQSIGFPVKKLELLLSILNVLAVAIGIQAIGVVLMSALLITPAAAARYWTNQLSKMIMLAAFLGALAGVMGTYISYVIPKMPTGPWVVTFLSLIALFSVLFGSRRGVWRKEMQLSQNRKKMLQENILKCFYHLGETNGEFYAARSWDEIQEKRLFKPQQLKKGLRQLLNNRMIIQTNGKFKLSLQGFEKGKRITKIHRLWELYLSTHLHLADDHVHEDAEAIEHLITVDLEKELEQHLDFPKFDPHQEKIPY